MHRTILILLIALTFTPTASFSNQSSAKELVIQGITAYLNNGPDAAIKMWLKGSGMEDNTQALTQANMLRQIEDFYGKPESYDILRENKISPRSEMIVFTINHEKGLVYGRFQAYLTKKGGWVATEFKFHTEAAVLLPESIVFGKQEG